MLNPLPLSAKYYFYWLDLLPLENGLNHKKPYTSHLWWLLYNMLAVPNGG